MAELKIHTGYVVTENSTILVQIPDESRWGFSLADDDQTWPGGFGIAAEWEPIDDDDQRVTDEIRERIGWILRGARA